MCEHACEFVCVCCQKVTSDTMHKDMWYTSPFKKSSFLTRMAAQRGKKMMTAKSPNGVPGPSLSSSQHLNQAHSSPLPSTPASHPTRATSAPPFALPTTPSPCLPTRPHRSSALFAKAQASTSPGSSLLQQQQPAVRACHLLWRPSQPHAACCAQVSQNIKWTSPRVLNKMKRTGHKCTQLYSPLYNRNQNYCIVKKDNVWIF